VPDTAEALFLLLAGVVAGVIAAQLRSDAVGSSADALRWGLMACLCFVVLAVALVAKGLRAPTPGSE